MSPFVFGQAVRVEWGGVDISGFIVGAGGPFHLDPWQRAVLALYSVPFQMPAMRLARRRHLSAMHSAYRSRHR